MTRQSLTLTLLAVFFAAPLWAEPASNPWGIKISASGRTLQTALDSVRNSSAAYVRPADVFVEDWIKSGGKCEDCFTLRNSGLGLILTLRNNNKKTPPKDLGAYQKAVGQILEKFRPALIAIENEENSPAYYSPSDGLDAAMEYSKQLSVACEEAHQRNMRCSNGGLTGETAAVLTWFQYVSNGQHPKACDFAKRTLGAEELCKVKAPAQVPVKYRKSIEQGRKLLQVYKSSPIDYVNVHWYLRDAEAFKETVDFLQLVTNKPVITNEIGQRAGEEEFKNAARLQQAVKEKNLNYAVWHGMTNSKIIRDHLSASSGTIFSGAIPSRK